MIDYKIEKKLPTTSKGKVIVKFEHDFDSTVVKQASGLIIPERYVIESGDEDADTAWGVTTDRKAINPQVIDILSGEYAGRRAFVHYGAFEVAKWLNDHQAVIPEAMILFFIEPISCVPGTYLGDEVYSEYEKTAAGIILSSSLETKEGVKIYITNIPENAHPLVRVGTTVITVDQFQYDLIYEGKKYIKVDQREIVGIETETGYEPIGDVVLVEYLPDPAWDEWKRKNHDDKEAYLDKYYPHMLRADAERLYPKNLETPEPKFTHARILAIGDKVKPGQFSIGNILLVYRNYGCVLPNRQWILNMDCIVGVVLG